MFTNLDKKINVSVQLDCGFLIIPVIRSAEQDLMRSILINYEKKGNREHKEYFYEKNHHHCPILKYNRRRRDRPATT